MGVAIAALGLFTLLDIAGPFLGHMYLVVVDAYSNWLDVQLMNSITSESIIAKLKANFAALGLPQNIIIDNGPSQRLIPTWTIMVSRITVQYPITF